MPGWETNWSVKSNFRKMKQGTILVDRDIPFVEGVFEEWFTVRYLAGRAIGPEDVRDASALVIRTRTRCDAALLADTKVRLIATATIGTDHIDLPFCADHGIEVVSAPGCNAAAVAQYVRVALRTLGLVRPGATLGVVGVGHVGSLVAAECRQAGLRVLLNDPPRAQVEGPGAFTPLPALLAQADIVTLHIPLWPENRDFAGQRFFSMMRSGASLINASRGEVLDEAALLAVRDRLDKVVLDVWKNEPQIDLRLLAAADLATPHIAGYSIQGKINGTEAVVRAVGRRFGIPQLQQFTVRDVTIPDEPYDIRADDAALRRDPSAFERLRNGYAYRNDRL